MEELKQQLNQALQSIVNLTGKYNELSAKHEDLNQRHGRMKNYVLSLGDKIENLDSRVYDMEHVVFPENQR